MSKLTGKVAVVTGASKGIGAAIAKAFGAEGASVVVNYASDKAGAEKTVAAITGAGGKAVAVQAQVNKTADVERLFAETVKAFGEANVLVNNAGIFEFMPLEAITEENYRKQFDVNVLGTLLAAQAAAKHFGDKGGSIINVGSVITTTQMPTSTLYAATKGAVDQITGVLANELGPKQIRVNSINPGQTLTEGTIAFGAGADSEMVKMAVSMTPLGRLGKPEDIARLAVFLASDESSWVTGELVRSSGGLR